MTEKELSELMMEFRDFDLEELNEAIDDLEGWIDELNGALYVMRSYRREQLKNK